MTGTANRTTRILGTLALLCGAGVVYFGLVATPPDVVQGDLVRLIYVHPAVSTMAFVAFGITALASLLYLLPRTRSLRWDRLAGASAEVGVVFCALSLATGSIWGRPAWGVWWTWDARLTLTALLCALFVGYLALRRTGGALESPRHPFGRRRRAVRRRRAHRPLRHRMVADPAPGRHAATGPSHDPRLTAVDHAAVVRGFRADLLVARDPSLPTRATGKPPRDRRPGARLSRTPGRGPDRPGHPRPASAADASASVGRPA